MAIKLYPHDTAEYLDSEEIIEAYINSALETNDSAYIAKALGVVARARKMHKIAEKTDLSREQLYRSLSEQGNPTLKTILAVLKALGLDLMVKTRTAAVGASGARP